MKYFLLDDIIKKQEEESFISSLFEGKNISVSIIYNSIYSNTKFLREFVYKITKNAQIDSKWRTRLVLIIDELNNNAIEYGSKQNDENLLQIEISTLDNIVDITISVKDAGTGIHCKSADEMRHLEQQHLDKNYTVHHSIRGRGLFLITTQLVDTLDFEDHENGGLIVRFKKKIYLDNQNNLCHKDQL